MREQFELWFKTTEANELLEEMNYFKMDLFHFVDGRNAYRHSSVQIAFMVWQARQAEVDHLTEMNQRYIGKMQEQQDQIAELKATTKGSFRVGEFSYLMAQPIWQKQFLATRMRSELMVFGMYLFLACGDCRNFRTWW